MFDFWSLFWNKWKKIEFSDWQVRYPKNNFRGHRSALRSNGFPGALWEAGNNSNSGDIGIQNMFSENSPIQKYTERDVDADTGEIEVANIFDDSNTGNLKKA